MKPKKIEDRIRDAFIKAKTIEMSYHALAYFVFPKDQFPRAWRRATGGGPPGCYMALTRAINKMGLRQDWDRSRRRSIYAPRDIWNEVLKD